MDMDPEIARLLHEDARRMEDLEAQIQRVLQPQMDSVGPAAREWAKDWLASMALRSESMHALANGDIELADELDVRAKYYDTALDDFDRFVRVKPDGRDSRRSGEV